MGNFFVTSYILLSSWNKEKMLLNSHMNEVTESSSSYIATNFPKLKKNIAGSIKFFTFSRIAILKHITNFPPGGDFMNCFFRRCSWVSLGENPKLLHRLGWDFEILHGIVNFRYHQRSWERGLNAVFHRTRY